MHTTHHSEYLTLQSLFIKRTEAAFVSQQLLNQQWQALHYLSQPNFALALKEYADFEAYLSQAGVALSYFPFDKSLSIDSLYCRDASIATDFGMIICSMGKSGRINEPLAQKRAFEDHHLPILGEIMAPGTLEGGDVAWLDDKTLAVGHTYRTNASGIAQLKAMLEPRGIEIIVVPLPHYKGPSDVFHLMSILSPVDKNLAVVYSPLMPIAFRKELLHRGFDLIEVPTTEFEAMACNVLAIAPRKCIMLEGNPQTQAALLQAGCEVLTYSGMEISVKGGGGPTCLTRPMLRIR
ncbi:MAG: arginine deiminase family protein [Saprospiraceae bacterium]